MRRADRPTKKSPEIKQTDIELSETRREAGPSSSGSSSRRKRQVSSSAPDRYISQFPPSTKLQYSVDCKFEPSSGCYDGQKTSLLTRSGSSSPRLVPAALMGSSSGIGANLFLSTPSSKTAKTYFPSPPLTSSSKKGLTRTLNQPTPSKKHESVMNDWKKIAIANPSLFYAPSAAKANSLKPGSIKQRIQEIAKTPEMVLDAPNVRDDYYTSLLAWSPTGNMLVGLDHECFLWNKEGLLSMVHQAVRPDYVVSVDFSPVGRNAAIGCDSGLIKIFDLERSNQIPSRTIFQSELSILKWKSENSIVTGYADGSIRVFDTRSQGRVVKELLGHHEDKICGLARCEYSNLFAVGGNEGVVTVWDQRKLDQPLWTITSHSSAVRAMEWCPWAPHILATGGGLDDESIHFHSTDTGKLLRTLPTGSQVCDLVWSTHYKELITAQNSEKNQLTIWKYPSLEKITSLPGHAQRPMHLVLSPDGQTVASLGDDEALKFWKCFPVSKGQKPLKYQQNERVDLVQPTISVFRLLYHKYQTTRSPYDNNGVAEYKFVIREPRLDSKIMSSLVLLDIQKHNDIIVVKNSSDIVLESLALATKPSVQSRYIYLSDRTSWIHWPNTLKMIDTELDPSDVNTTCLGCFTESGAIDFDFNLNPGVLISSEIAMHFVYKEQQTLFSSKVAPDLSYYASIRRFSSFLSQYYLGKCQGVEHLRIYGEPLMDLPTSHPYIADTIAVGGVGDRLGLLVKAAASHDTTISGTFGRGSFGRLVEALFRKQRWSSSDIAGALLNF